MQGTIVYNLSVSLYSTSGIFVECKLAFFDKKPNEMRKAFRLCALHRM